MFNYIHFCHPSYSPLELWEGLSKHTHLPINPSPGHLYRNPFLLSLLLCDVCTTPDQDVHDCPLTWEHRSRSHCKKDIVNRQDSIIGSTEKEMLLFASCRLIIPFPTDTRQISRHCSTITSYQVLLIDYDVIQDMCHQIMTFDTTMWHWISYITKTVSWQPCQQLPSPIMVAVPVSVIPAYVYCVDISVSPH